MNLYIIAYPLISQCFLTIFCFIMFIISNKYNDYFRAGPSKNLTLINVDINNNSLYFSSLALLCFLRLFIIIHKRITLNFINNNIYNLKHKNRYINYFTILIYLIESITQMILLKVFVTQMDYAIFIILISEMMFIPFNLYYINKYTTIPNRHSHILDVTTINPVFMLDAN
jgi:hypothetical protein